MQDRVSANPRRRLITPENGQPAFYATVEMADNPTVLGTPLNKASLLTDATAALFGLGADAVPDDVLEKARSLITTAQNAANSANSNANSRLQIKTGSYVGTGTNGVDNPTVVNIRATPKVFIVSYYRSSSPQGAIWIEGMESLGTITSGSGANNSSIVVETNPFTYYSSYNAAWQFNYKNYTYFWIAIY